MTTQAETPLEGRVSKLEGAYEQVNERLGALTQSIDGLRTELNSRFNTMLVLLATLWATVTGGFIALFVNG